MLNVNITSADKGLLYSLEIKNTQLDDSKNIGSYAATLSGVGLESPLTVKLRKFNRHLGAVKLSSRVLGRLFRKHMEQLATTPPVVRKTRTRSKALKEVKEAKEAKEAKAAAKEAKEAEAAAATTTQAPAATPAPEPAVAAPVTAFQI